MKLKIEDFINEEADLSLGNEEDLDKIAIVAGALSSPVRLQMLRQLQDGAISIPKLAEMNNLSITNCIFHATILENAKLINIRLVHHGKTNKKVRMCTRLLRKFNVNLFLGDHNEFPGPNKKVFSYTTRVGEFIYISEDVDACFATKDNFYFGTWKGIYNPERFNAEIIWSNGGIISYAFPNDFTMKGETEQLMLDIEVCSETLDHDNLHKSDITFWINDVELFTYRCPGDYGDRVGVLNPEYWSKGKNVLPTQYGDRLHIVIEKDAIYLNEVLVNKKFNMKSLHLGKGNMLKLTIGNKKGCEFPGGWNIFGKGFGDYPIDIELKAVVSKKSE